VFVGAVGVEQEIGMEGEENKGLVKAAKDMRRRRWKK